MRMTPRVKAADTVCLKTRTPSLEQAGGLQRMALRGHTGGVKKVLLAPGGIDVITSASWLPAHMQGYTRAPWQARGNILPS